MQTVMTFLRAKMRAATPPKRHIYLINAIRERIWALDACACLEFEITISKTEHEWEVATTNTSKNNNEKC